MPTIYRESFIGRAWIAATTETVEFEFFHNGFEPCPHDLTTRTVSDWCHEHFSLTYDYATVRKALGVGEGSWQVLFRGHISAVEDTPLEHDTVVDITDIEMMRWNPPTETEHDDE